MADLRQRVYSMLGQNNNWKNSDLRKYFLQESFKRQTNYELIKRDEIGLPTEDLPRIDHPTSFNGKNFKHVKKATANRIGASQLKLESKQVKVPIKS